MASTSTSPSPSLPSAHVFHEVNFDDENEVTLVRNKLTAHLPETLPLLYAFNNAHRTLTTLTSTSTSSSIIGIATPCWWYSTCHIDNKETSPAHDIKAIVGRLAMASLALSPWCLDEKDGISLLMYVLHQHHVPDQMIKDRHHTTSTPSDNPFTHITLSAILDRLKPMVMDVIMKCYHDGMARIGKKLDLVIQPEGDGLFYLPSRTNLNVIPSTSTATTIEFAIAPLTVDDAVTVNHHWPYGSIRTLPYVQECITTYQTAGIRVKQEDGTMYLVAWALEQPYGGLGMVFTRPEYRRRGLSGIIVCHLLLQLFELDSTRIPFVYIKHGNTASEKLFTTLGFKHVSAVSWDSVEFFHSDASNSDTTDASSSDSKQQQQ